MLTASGIRLVCFDLGGVLLAHHRCWEVGCTAAGLDVRADTGSIESRKKRAPIVRQYGMGKLSHDQYIKQMAQATGDLYTPDEIDRIHHAWLLDAYPDLDQTIHRLHEVGLVTACLSNTNEAHWRRLLSGEYPAVVLLKHHFASHLLGHAKPDGAIYRAFEEQVGFAGTEILFFDDLPDNIATAHSLGWHAHLIDHTESTAPQIEAALTACGLFK